MKILLKYGQKGHIHLEKRIELYINTTLIRSNYEKKSESKSEGKIKKNS